MIMDTCALLWLAEGGGRLTPRARDAIGGAAAIHVSAITGFEIGVKYRAGKLTLPTPPVDWLKRVLAHHDVSVAPLDMEDCVLATELPFIHRDPCDRLIIASAQRRGWPIVTADPRFRDYGVAVVW